MNKMGDKKLERVSIFIDGSNFYNGTKILNVVGKINFQKLVNELVGDRELTNVFYYVAPLDFQTDPNKYWKHQKFLNVLRKIPKFNVVLCTLRKVKKKNGNFKFVSKGDDIYLANDFLVGAYENIYDTAVIVSGDEDFVSIIKTAQRLGKKVENVYFKPSSSYMLRRECNLSLHIKKIIPQIIN